MTEKAYNVGIYCRLSNDDERDGESVSIENQKLLLTQYVKDRGWNLVDTYIEAGVIIGLNTARPLRHIGSRCFGSILQLFEGLTLWRHSHVRILPV